jgi:hypothetical protein
LAWTQRLWRRPCPSRARRHSYSLRADAPALRTTPHLNRRTPGRPMVAPDPPTAILKIGESMDPTRPLPPRCPISAQMTVAHNGHLSTSGPDWHQCNLLRPPQMGGSGRTFQKDGTGLHRQTPSHAMRKRPSTSSLVGFPGRR